MKFRAVRPAALGAVDAIVVPLSSDGAAPSGLPRAVKTVVDRIAKAETGAGRLYGVTTHHGEPRVVVVGIGRASELDTERAHNFAAAGIKSLCELILHALDVHGLYPTEACDRHVEVSWTDPLPIDESRRIADALSKAQLGIPASVLRAELGYPDQ